jgi:hypothetical protein
VKTAKSTILRISNAALCTLALAFAASAQSRDQNFPTAVNTNEINGTIKARDIGDSRLTSYYYVFDGGQGDIFVNVVTKNFSGDIDVFNQDALQPLTKMVIYADAGVSETGRLIYLRKPERLILRIEGRSPNDDPATFRIKFAGSFIAIKGQKGEAAPTIERTETDESRMVNSVGTRVEVPKRLPPSKTKETPPSVVSVEEKKTDEIVAEKEAPKPEEKVEKKPVVLVEALPPATIFGKPAKPKVTARRNTRPAKTAKVPEEKKPDPLASIRLVVLLKDGTMIERPMSEVQRFGVEKGMLTVIAKDGSVSRHSILNVAKVTIE